MLRVKALWLALIAIAILAAGIGASIHRLGRASAEAEITKINQEVQDEADQASSVFQRCIDDGGLYDFATRKCGRR